MSGFGRGSRQNPNDRSASSSRVLAKVSASVDTPWEMMPRELQRDETLIWADRPVNLMAHARTMWFQALTGIPFLAFALFWTWSAASAIGDTGDLFGKTFPLFGLIFIFAGLAMILSPVWAVLKAKRVVYGLTDHRLIIRQQLPSTSLRSWPIANLGPLEREGEGRTGNMIFALDTNKSWHNNGSSLVRIGFVGIPEPKRLEQAIEDLRKANLKS